MSEKNILHNWISTFAMVSNSVAFEHIFNKKNDCENNEKLMLEYITSLLPILEKREPKDFALYWEMKTQNPEEKWRLDCLKRYSTNLEFDASILLADWLICSSSRHRLALHWPTVPSELSSVYMYNGVSAPGCCVN